MPVMSYPLSQTILMRSNLIVPKIFEGGFLVQNFRSCAIECPLTSLFYAESVEQIISDDLFFSNILLLNQPFI